MNAYRRQAPDEDEDDWDEEDPADADDADADDRDTEPTVPCPYCKEEILEDSPHCPYCERYLSEEDLAAARKPLWVILTALVCLGIAIWLVFAAF